MKSKDNNLDLSNLLKLTQSISIKFIITLVALGMTITSCHNSTPNQATQNQTTSDSTQTSVANSNEIVITDNVAFNKEYVTNPDAFKKKYLNQQVTFTGFFYKKNPFRDEYSYFLKYPNAEKIGPDQILLLEVKFKTPKPNDIPYSTASEKSDNKYWIFSGQDKKLIEQMNTHNNNDINEQPLDFYKPKLVEYIDETSQETKGYLLGYNDNALRQVFKKYSQLYYKPTNDDDFDNNNVFILSTILVKGKVTEINVDATGEVWIQLSDEKIVSAKSGFSMDGAKLINVGSLKNNSTNAADTTNN